MQSERYVIQGFKGSAVAAGLKKKDNLDLGLIFSEKEAVAAGVFTTNRATAAPVILSREHAARGRARAIIANAGNANACTGQEGIKNARLTASLVAEQLNIEPEEVLVASTGVIGAQLDMDCIGRALPDLVGHLADDDISRVAEAIMTTDSFSKISHFQGTADGKPFQILGIAKGAGMIMPHMATMLCFIMSDIAIQAEQLQQYLSKATERSFNRISVDGDTSTNDTVLALANGMAGNGPLSTTDSETFQRGLIDVMEKLAIMIVKDGEGATKVITLTIKGAASDHDASTASRTIANSSLVKTAFYGQDPNWGRIMAALGRSGIDMEEDRVSIWIDDVKIVEGGLGMGIDREKEAAEKMKKRDIALTVDLNMGHHEDRIFTCDLTHDYVSINADYRS